MNTNTKTEPMTRKPAGNGQLRIIVVAVFCFSAGLALGGLYFSRSATSGVAVSPEVNGQVIETAAAVPASVAVAPAPVDPATIEAVKRVVPNATLISVEGGSQRLRDAALVEFQNTLKELQARQKKVEADFSAARSEEEQRAAAQKLRELQVEQMETLKQIAADAQAQIDAFKQLKTAAR